MLNMYLWYVILQNRMCNRDTIIERVFAQCQKVQRNQQDQHGCNSWPKDSMLQQYYVCA